MTKEFIKHTLKEITGFSSPMNQWLTLTGCCQRIGMLSDNNIGIDPLHKMFYFDEDDEMLYIRKFDGELIKTTETRDGYVSLTLNGTQYLNKISESTIDHEDAGVFHQCVSFDKLVAFYYPDMNDDVKEAFLSEIRDGI